jgi:hypothetical protein
VCTRHYPLLPVHYDLHPPGLLGISKILPLSQEEDQRGNRAAAAVNVRYMFSSCSPPSASLRPLDKEAMQDRYYASMRQQDDFDDFSFAPQHQRYKRYEQPRRYEQRYEPRQLCYNGGRIVDPVEQLRQLLQAAPLANAPAPPALPALPAVAQVHQVQLPAAQPLNLGAANAAAHP